MGALLPAPPWREPPLIRYGGGGVATRIVCGFVNCEELLFNPFLRSLPAVVHARPGEDPAARWLENTIRYAAHEANRTDPGSRSVLPRLTELMFVEVLRHHMRSLPHDEVSWLAAANDPILGKALGWLHREPAEPWTVEDLARRVGVSRTALADRFVQRLGEPPMHYLARWRLQVGAQLLRTTNEPLKAIAEQVGYESEAAFGRAFRRLFGLPPAGWRRRSRGSTPSAGAA
jgi:AraC-like DNA-binding protein